MSVDDLEIENMVSEEIDSRDRTASAANKRSRTGFRPKGLTLPAYRDFLRGQIRQQSSTSSTWPSGQPTWLPSSWKKRRFKQFFDEQREAIGDTAPYGRFRPDHPGSVPSDSVWEAALAEAAGSGNWPWTGRILRELARTVFPGRVQGKWRRPGWFRRGDMVLSSRTRPSAWPSTRSASR